MTRVRTLLARAIVLALLLLTITGGLARADTGWSGNGDASINTLPDDPGYDLQP